jgi:hypothetical protein
MVTVYLDQAKWIDLARAAHRRPGGEPYEFALKVARESVSLGVARFPLSAAHYIETWRHSNPARRRRLAETMSELSQHVTMAYPPALCDNELDAFLYRQFQVPAQPRRYPVFGRGNAHSGGWLRPPFYSALFEHERLAKRPEQFLEPDDSGHGQRNFAENYIASERDFATTPKTFWGSRETREAVLAASAVLEISEHTAEALKLAGLPEDCLGPIGQARRDLPHHEGTELLPSLLNVAREFIAQLPTRDAVLRLRILRHQNPSTQWEINDFNDITFIACAAVHCDVVVTEKQWCHELRRSGLLNMHLTTTIHDVRDLPEVLATTVR